MRFKVSPMSKKSKRDSGEVGKRTIREEVEAKDDWFPSVWGKNDELGALNLIDKSKILKTIKDTVSSGKAYSLSHEMEYGIPVHWFNGPFLYSTFRDHASSSKLYSNVKNKFAAMSTRMELSDHTGTHLDGLNHVSVDGRLYNGYFADDITGTFGTEKLGIETIPPIITRGIHVDIPSLLGKEILQNDHLITADEIQTALVKNDYALEKGDALIISTGWDNHWMNDNERYNGSCPGISLDAAKWAVKRKVALIGSDTWKVEIHPPEFRDQAAPVHQFLIAKNGVMLIENMNLGQLRKDKIREFLFVCLPLKLKGGAGSPVNPVAIV
jgi:kynurenine formamidase